MPAITTTATQSWAALSPSAPVTPTLALTGQTDQTIDAFGGCFNEIGWDALQSLDAPTREAVFRELFDPAAAVGGGGGCKFTLCRLPIGASDYGLEWYSHNETVGDFAMAHFSIARDEQYLLPYVRAAKKYQPKLRLFASPWSPPTWLKSPRAYNYGTLIWKPEYLRAYALYFLKFVQAYRAAGVPIEQLHVQNEPCADQKFPSCLWTGQQMGEFIGNYLAPLFQQHHEPCQIWLGTLNTDDYTGFPLTALSDPQAAAAIAGMSLQWGGKGMVQRCHAAFPKLPLMQSENECGDGKNTWSYAHYIFALLQHYLTNGVSSYIYWNMILPPGGRSTWGWNQNAMITVDPATKAVTYNPEFYVMKHFAHFVAAGAVRQVVSGAWAGNTVAFRNPDGKLVIVANNPLDREMPLTLANPAVSYVLPASSFTTIVV